MNEDIPKFYDDDGTEVNPAPKRHMLVCLTHVGVLLLCMLVGCIPSEEYKGTSSDSNTSKHITIANWNLQVFGTTKASNSDVMQIYSDIIDDYDIIFVQEIRNKDQTAFPKLCDLLPDYSCTVSSRAGRSSSKEQYGVIYKEGIEILEFKDYNPDSQDRWERPPIKVTFDIGGYELVVYNIHAKPDDVQNEIDFLQDVVQTEGNVIIIGDMNADCSYYNPFVEDDFEDWYWLIEDDEDTTVSSTNCAYDRIIINEDAYAEYNTSGIYTTGIDSAVSDHYLVWIELEAENKPDLSISCKKDGLSGEEEFICEAYEPRD